MTGFEGFAEEARANSGYNRRSHCGVADLLNALAGEDAEQVEKVLDDRGVSANAIHDALKRRIGNQAPSPYTIQRHRRRGCACYVDTRGAEIK